ncbi:MAG: hypothetical protein ACTHK2_00325 [Dokdonella sp.]|uniref:hypothetical protein n=1 Tax=Dokdonella sp. TaxID=2291710 RepID=UPI003F8177C7
MSSFRYGFVLAILAVCAAFLVPQTSRAAIGALDDTPGSTLLFPYFEVDLGDPAGRDTVLTLQNASATAMLAHTIVWSDEGVASAIFDIYLTGYDIISFSMRDVLNGTLPLTASDGQDPADTISPQGPYSQDINFASCTGRLPYAPGTIPAPAGMTPADLRNALTGAPTSGIAAGMCWGRNVGDGRARGYVTTDLVSFCSDLKPGDAGYADVPFAALTAQNSLLGSFIIATPATSEWFVDSALSLESTYSNDPSPITTPGNYTFYGRYNGWNAGDRREPLPTTWVSQGELDTSSLIVWRDTKTNGQPHACGADPAYYPLGQEGFATFSPDSSYGGAGAGTPLANAAQLAPASVLGPVSGKLGQFFANLNTSVPAGSNPPSDPAAAQSYVGVARAQLGEQPVASGHRAVPLDKALNAQHFIPHN